jgi:hypothetical protein
MFHEIIQHLFVTARSDAYLCRAYFVAGIL